MGNASYAAPTAQVHCTVAPLGTPGHSWQMVSAAGSSLGEKGAIHAAKVLAGTAAMALADPELLKRAKEEWQEVMRDRSGALSQAP